MTCTACGHANPAESSFCLACGQVNQETKGMLYAPEASRVEQVAMSADRGA